MFTEQSFFCKGDFLSKKVLIVLLCPVMPESAAMTAVFNYDFCAGFEMLHKENGILLLIMLFFLVFLP